MLVSLNSVSGRVKFLLEHFVINFINKTWVEANNKFVYLILVGWSERLRICIPKADKEKRLYHNHSRTRGFQKAQTELCVSDQGGLFF